MSTEYIRTYPRITFIYTSQYIIDGLELLWCSDITMMYDWLSFFLLMLMPLVVWCGSSSMYMKMRKKIHV